MTILLTTLIFLTFLCLLGTIIWMHSSSKKSSEAASWEMARRDERVLEKVLETQREREMTREKLLDRILMGRDPDLQAQTEPLLPTSDGGNSLSFEEEYERLDPRVQAQINREEAERIWSQAPFEEGINPLATFDPRVPVIDPTKTPEEGSEIWSPSFSQMDD